MHVLTKGAVVAALLTIAGCASIPSAGIDNAKQLPPDGGVVAVQVVTNSAHLSDRLRNWTQVIVVQEGAVDADGKPLIATIPALTDGLSTTRVFVGILKPGHYRFLGVSGFAKPGDFSYSMDAVAPPTVGRFQVQTARLTNLGTVLFQPFHPDPLATSMLSAEPKTGYAMSRLDDATSLSSFVAQRYPEQYRVVQANAELSWDADKWSALRTRLASAIREYAVTSQPHYLAVSKEAAYTARLGTLYRRHDDGTWSICHLPTNYELLAMDDLPDGGAVAGGERGNLWYASQPCGDWKAAPLPDPAQNVIWIDAHTTAAVHVLTDEYGRYRLYSANRDGQWQWRLIKEFGKSDPPNYLYQADYAERPPAVYRRGETLFLSAHDSPSYEFNLRTATVAASKTEAVTQAITQPDGTIVARAGNMWFGASPPRVSRDGGQSWIEYARLGTFWGTPYVFPNGDAVATADAAKFVFVGWKKNQTVDVVLSHDKGKTSDVIGHVPYGCDELQTAISRDNLLFTRCFDGSMLRSADGGRTWTADFSRAVRADAIPREFFGETLQAPAR